MRNVTPEALAELRKRGGDFVKCNVRVTFSPDPTSLVVRVYVYDPVVKRTESLELWYKHRFSLELSSTFDDITRALFQRYRLIAFELCEHIEVEATMEILHDPYLHDYATTEIVTLSPDFENPVTGTRNSFRDFRTLHYTNPVIVG